MIPDEWAGGGRKGGAARLYPAHTDGDFMV